MKIGIIGLPQTGKKTLFSILTGTELKDSVKGSKSLPGMADIIDSRFDRLVEMYQPKKNVRARIEFVLLPKIESDTISKGEIFRDIADMDAICHVIRAFEDEAVYHAGGSVNAFRDFETVNAELILHDQIFAEKRIERLSAMTKKIKDEDQEKELALMHRLKDFLEAEKALRQMELTEDEEKIIKSYPFITQKKMVIALNVSESELDRGELGNEDVLTPFQESGDVGMMAVSAKVEAEIALLDTKEEKEEFLKALGIKETALENLTRLCLQSLNLLSFFTVGKDEVRQWLLKKGSNAPKAAGTIHSDLERGFIRAEVFKYSELMEKGNEAELKKAGQICIEGKDYLVKDGDIINIRFAV